jgi:ferrous-iron efflux pump FieF
MLHKDMNRAQGEHLSRISPVILASVLSVVVASVLTVSKTVVLYLSGSPSVLASLTDSALDLLASIATLFAVRYARTPPDKEHPFGHGKAEAFSALFQAALVFASAAIILQECFRDFANPQPARASGLSLSVLVLSIGLTAVLVWFQNRALRAERSVAVSGDRMHYLTDFVTNIVAIVGVGLAALGLHVFDAIAGVLMAAWFVWGAIGVLREASGHLMDRALDDKDVEAIRALTLRDAQILGVHELRTRQAGPYVLIQMHVELDPQLTLDAAHRIIISAENRLIEVYPNADIIIHPDPRGLAEPHTGVFQDSPPSEQAQG